MCSSCAAPCCTSATLVSWARKLTRISSENIVAGPARGQQAVGSGEASQQAVGFVQRKAHDTGLAAFDIAHEAAGIALDAVGPGLVEGIAGRDVGGDLGR